MSQHTPGKWSVLLGRSTIVDSDAGGVAMSFGASDLEAKANARLIAAAPELLEAAERALVEHEDAGCSCRGCQMLRAAIAAAKGGAP